MLHVVLTLEEVVLEAAVLHVLVDEQAVLVLAAVADQLHQVGMPQLPQEDHLRLHHQQGEQENHVRISKQFTCIFCSPRAAVGRTSRRRWATQLIRVPPEPRNCHVAQPPCWLSPQTSASPCAPRYFYQYLCLLPNQRYLLLFFQKT